MKVFIAGIKTALSYEKCKKVISESNLLYALESFNEGEKACDEALELVGNENLLIDSGAFSYMNSKNATKEEIDEFVARYINYINKSDIKYFMEMDLDEKFGIKQVEKWRAKIERETNKKCIPVWHMSRGIDYWKKMCEEYDYIAIGGFVTGMKKENYPLIKKMLKYAKFKGVKVHGLGFTKTKILKEFDFYSVDSTTWVSAGAIAGDYCKFKNNKIVRKHIDKAGKENKKVNIQLLVANNLYEWIKYQIYMDGRK